MCSNNNQILDIDVITTPWPIIDTHIAIQMQQNNYEPTCQRPF